MDGGNNAGGEEITFLWRVIIPVAIYFWVVGIFFIWAIIWILLIIRRVFVSLWSIRLVPLFLIGFYIFLLPFQPAQQDLIEITETVLDCIDNIWNRGVRLFLNDLILCFNPACTIYNFFVRLGAALLNLVIDPIRDALSKRFFFEGADPPPPGEFAFDFFEEACEVIEFIFTLILETIEFLVERIWAFIMFFYTELILEMNFNPLDLFIQFMNFFFRCIIDIPCMKFDDAETFAVSIVNCVCQFSPFFDATSPDPPCSGEIEDGDDIPSGLVCCIGLGCFLNDDGSFPSIPDEFAVNFVDNCLGGIGGIPDLEDLVEDLIDGIDIPDLRDEPQLVRTIRKGRASKLRRASRVAAEKIETFKKQKIEPLSISERLSGGLSRWFYDQEDQQEVREKTQKALQGFFDSIHAVFQTISWDSEGFNFQAPSYGEIRRTLYVNKAPEHLKTIGTVFYDHVQEKLNSKPRMELFVRLRTIVTLCVWRTLAPHKLEETSERLKKMGPQYEAAVHSSLLTLREVDPQFDNMTALLRKVYWERGGVLKYHEHPTRPGSHHSAIIDSMDVLQMLGISIPRHLGHNVTAVRVVSRGKNLEIHTYYGASGPEGSGTSSSSTIQVGTTVATRVPWAAILIPILKNWQLFAAALVPFVTSDYGIFVINSYVAFLLDIFGDIFQEPLDIDVGDLLDIAIEFTDITINNIFLGLNKIIRYLLCRIWSFIISGLMRLVPGVGLIFGSIFQKSTFFTSYCPPQPLIVNKEPAQNPIEYLLDMLDCFGRPMFSDDECDPFEVTPPLMCTTKADCPGEPPCRCRTDAQFPSIFWSFEDNKPCPMDSGFCMCWPLLPCGQSGDTEFFPAFRFPTFDLSSPFAKDCVEDFGYRITNIIVYPWPPSPGKLLSTFKDLIDNTWNNFIIWVKYLTRQISAGNLLQVSTWRFLIWIPVLIFIAGNYLTSFALAAILTFIAFGLPIISELLIEDTIPILEGLGSLGDKILDFIRFPNFSPAEPLGHPVSGENICWLVNIPTALGAAGILYIVILFLYHFLIVGALFGIFAFLFETIAIIPRIILACCWYNSRTERRAEFRQRLLAEGLALSQASRELVMGPPPPAPVQLGLPQGQGGDHRHHE